MSQATQEFPQGITVKELKDILAGWPEQDGHGNPTQVWIKHPVGKAVSVVQSVSNSGVDLTDPQAAADIYLGTT